MERIPVLFCADAAYFPHMRATISSLLTSNPAHSFQIIVCSAEHNVDEQLKTANLSNVFGNTSIEFVQFGLENYRERLPLSKHFTASTYLRLFLTEFLPRDIKKVLYLDSDVIVRADIGDLWRSNVSEYYVAAVPEPYKAYHPYFDKDDTYYNAGVLIINAEKWRADNVLPKLLNFLDKNFSLLTAHDQDVLNNVFRGRILALPQCWNFQPNFADFTAAEMGMGDREFRQLRRSPKVIHYTGKFKPWLYMQEPHYKRYYRDALKCVSWEVPRPTDLTAANVVRKAFKMSKLKERANWYFPRACSLARKLSGKRSRVDVDPAIG